MDDLRVKTFVGIVKGVNAEEYTVDVVCSDETIDRYREVVLAEAWKGGLKEFKKHPVLVSSHAYGDLRKQIGEIVKISVDSEAKQLVATCKYYVGEGNPEADWGWKIAEKGRAAYSVGFRSKAYEEVPYEEWKDDPKKARLYYTEVELLELSHVLIPANPAALQKAIELGDVAKGIQDLLAEDPTLAELAKETEVEVEREAEQEETPVEEVQKTDEEVALESEVLEAKEGTIDTSEILETLAGLKSDIEDIKSFLVLFKEEFKDFKPKEEEVVTVVADSDLEIEINKQLETEDSDSYINEIFEEDAEKKKMNAVMDILKANADKLKALKVEAFGASA